MTGRSIDSPDAFRCPSHSSAPRSRKTARAFVSRRLALFVSPNVSNFFVVKKLTALLVWELRILKEE